MLGGLAVRPCHAGAPGRLSQQGPTNTQGPPAAMPDPDNRSRRAPGSSGLAGLWPVAGLFSFRVLLVRNLRHIQSFLINIGPDTLTVPLPIGVFIHTVI